MMVEVIDALLMTPVPYPKDFVSTRVHPLARLKLSVERNAASSMEGVDAEIYPGFAFSIFASGSVPYSSGLTVVCSVRYKYSDDLQAEDGDAGALLDDDGPGFGLHA